MLRRALPVCFLLPCCLSSSSFAGVVITLVPNTIGPYQPGQQINIDVFAQLTPGTPSVPGPGGTTTSIRVRMMQFDFSDTHPALLQSIVPAGHHPIQESQMFSGPIPFWDYSGSWACANDEASCGLNYFVDGSLTDSTPNIVNTTYASPASSSNLMVTLNQAVPKRIGEFAVTLPSEPGTYVLDVLNADEADENKGADIRWGFGTLSDPTDPTSPLRANTGGITYGLKAGPMSIAVVPEPPTLALLALGAFVTCFRRLQPSRVHRCLMHRLFDHQVHSDEAQSILTPLID